MSQSPTQDSTSDEVRRYDVGWVATNKLIRQGRSFSGGERNCAFLNLGDGGRFATISGAAGLDLIDDGRGLASCDWDYDGRSDLWVTNRTGPRLRFLHNRFESGNNSVAIRLVGTESNRDAVGARVTIELSGGRPVSKTLFAGNAYLSQSSKWLSFGVPAGETVGTVSVRWPGGETELFSGVEAGGFFVLAEGGGKAIRWRPPSYDRSIFDVEGGEGADRGGAARVVLINRPPMPSAPVFINSEGEEETLAAHVGKPLVLQLWATWCPNCEDEMGRWKAAADAVRETGANVIPLCVDEPTVDRAADLAAAGKAIVARGYPWATGLATASLIDHLNIVQKSFIGRQEDLPLPSTFLIDGGGKLAAIYKGSVDPEVLIADLRIANGGEPREAILDRALPYRGKWMEPPPGVMPRGIAIGLVEHGLGEEAKAYLFQLLPVLSSEPDGEDQEARDRRLRELSECHIFLGAIHYDEGDKEKAVGHYLEAKALFPDNRKVRHELMRCYIDLGQPADAAEQVEALLEARPDDFENLAQLAVLKRQTGETGIALGLFERSLELREHPETRLSLANLLRDLGRSGEAVANYRAVLEALPESPLAANNVAWILSTHPDASVRDGQEAVRMAQVAARATNRQVPAVLSTLAAAHAEAGDFAAAEQTLREAIELAQVRGESDMVERLNARLRELAQRKPTRDANLLPDAK